MLPLQARICLTIYYKTLTYNVTNVDGKLQFFLAATRNYVGPVTVYFFVSYDPNWYSAWLLYQEYGWTGFVPPPPNYDQQVYTFVFGDTPIFGQSNNVTALASGSLSNVILATFTNGVSGSSSRNFTASINWGDDSISSGFVTANAAGEKAVLGSHAYAYPGTYPVYVQVQSAIGASATILSFVTVTNQITPATDVLTVQVTGQGTVSPDDNNASLAVGSSYSLTATPAALCVLTSWTDGNGFVLGTGTNLNFTMYPGLSLTANFQVATNPVLTVVSPSSGQLITNLYSMPVTVSGTASNNATVTNVWYQVNSGGWQAASGTTNWSASFNPAYGVTNVFQAYAVNNFGYVSTTNTVRVKYLAGDVLTVNTNGLGIITPNLNGQLLPLSTNYALTATPASGFEFTNWTGSLTTNGATLKFTMATNLTFIANFLDTNKPTLSITNPVAGQRVSNAVFVVMGAVSDNWQVSNVVCQINGGAWSNAAPANGGSSWTATVNLIPGTNKVAAYAVDTSGNVSTTNSVSFQFVVTNQLGVRAIGLGTTSPNYSNAWLEIGRNYSITSAPASGFVFTNWLVSTNWLGGIKMSKTNLQFMMASNLTLQANFAGRDPAHEHHYRAHCRPAHDQCSGNRRWHRQRQLEGGRRLVSAQQRSLEPSHNHECLDELDHHAAAGCRLQHRKGVCDGFGRKLFHHEQRECALEQYIQAATKFYPEPAADQHRVELYVATFIQSERPHSGLHQPDRAGRR